MVFKLRTRNSEFETGTFIPWVASGDATVSDDIACSGFWTARLGPGTGYILQDGVAYPNRSFEIQFRVGAVGGLATSPLVVTLDFYDEPGFGQFFQWEQQRERSGGAYLPLPEPQPKGRLLRRFSFTVPAADIPTVGGATPVGCLKFDLDAGLSPNNTRRFRLTFSKPVAGGADLIVDAIHVIERTVP